MKKNIMLEEETTELKKKIAQLVEEHTIREDELKQELESLRKENRLLRLSISRFADQLDRHILDFETNTSE